MRNYDVAVLGSAIMRSAFYDQLRMQSQQAGTNLSEPTVMLPGLQLAVLKLSDEEQITLKFVGKSHVLAASRTDGYLQLEDLAKNLFKSLIEDARSEQKEKSRPVVAWNGTDAYQSLIGLKNVLKPIYDQREKEDEPKEQANETTTKAIAADELKSEEKLREKHIAEAEKVIKHLGAFYERNADEESSEQSNEDVTEKKGVVAAISSAFSQFFKPAHLSEEEIRKRMRQHSPQTWQKMIESEDDVEIGPQEKDKSVSKIPSPKK